MKEIAELLNQRKEKIFRAVKAGDGNIPVVCAGGGSLPEAWENSLLGLYAYGADITTQYDKTDDNGNIIDPPSKDCTMHLIVEDPMSDPFIHKAFPGGLEDLEEYRQEVLEGVKDHWVRDPMNPDDKRWEYTYHERLFNYRRDENKNGVDQIQQVISQLAAAPHTRRAQAITWQPWKDAGIEDPPCLQSLWFRILESPEGEEKLNMNVRFRSRDAYDAAFMNCFALVLLQEKVADELSRATGRKIRPGRYIDSSDSYHIYGRRMQDFRERFISQLLNRTIQERTWTRAFAEEIFVESREKISRKIAGQDEKYKK